MSGVALDIGVQHVLEHQFHLPRHASERGAGAVHGRMVHDRLGPLGDVLGVVADPLEVGGDAEDRQHGPQIARDRLALRDDARGLLVDLLIERVDGGVAFAHACAPIRGRGPPAPWPTSRCSSTSPPMRMMLAWIASRSRSKEATMCSVGAIFYVLIVAQPIRPVM
jgi:hypothetical protein